MASEEQIGSFLLSIALYNPYEVNLLADKYGMPRPSNIEESIGMLQVIMEDKGDEGLADVAYAHPDRELIVEAAKIKTTKLAEARADGYSAVETSAEENKTKPFTPTVTHGNRVTVSNHRDFSNKERLMILIVIALVFAFIFNSKE